MLRSEELYSLKKYTSRNKKHSYEPDRGQNMSSCTKKTFQKEKKRPFYNQMKLETTCTLKHIYD